MSKISTQAIVESGVRLASNVEVAAFAVIKSGTVLESGVRVDHHAVIGGLPQDLHFKPDTMSGVQVGAGTVIREGVTISRGTVPGGSTRVGHSCMLMANSHLGHDVFLGDNVIVANGVLMGGHVTVGDHCFVGGAALLHQSVRVGEGAIIGGGSRISMDIPPFVLACERNCASGVNLVGMKRRGFSQEIIGDVKACYKAVYFYPGRLAHKAEAALERGLAKTPYGEMFLRFFLETKRGVIHSANE